ncbi:MAG: hypothetical protein LBP59_03075 [Planctomycetaceae bacterium]|jgi:hypothetical protein|nr:hypothetical protein [Planctomycetaceae bacterium]
MESKSVFDKIVEEFFFQNRLELQDTLENFNVLFAVFSYVPFGFVLPDKKFLKKLPRRNITKRIFLMREAEKKWKSLLRQAADGDLDYIFTQMDDIQKELSPWLIFVKQLDEFEKIVENYMLDQIVSWDCQSFNKNQSILFCVNMWIQN